MIERICVDFSKTGLSMFFKPYQVEVLRLLLSERPNELNSGDVHKHLLYVSEIMISRASVINFLTKMESWGLLNTTTHTGKGGHHDRYSIYISTERELIDWIHRRLNDKILGEIK